jgi:hypothetical protein
MAIGLRIDIVIDGVKGPHRRKGRVGGDSTASRGNLAKVDIDARRGRLLGTIPKLPAIAQPTPERIPQFAVLVQVRVTMAVQDSTCCTTFLRLDLSSTV